MRKIVFQDSKQFYTELKEVLSSDQEVEIVTDYERFSDLPQDLKDIFELHYHRSNKWINIHTGAFIPMSKVAAGINLKPLYVIATAGVGAVAGGIAAGPIGATVGAGVGAIVGICAAAMDSEKYKVDIQVDINGKLRLVVCPKKAV